MTPATKKDCISGMATDIGVPGHIDTAAMAAVAQAAAQHLYYMQPGMLLQIQQQTYAMYAEAAAPQQNYQ